MSNLLNSCELNNDTIRDTSGKIEQIYTNVQILTNPICPNNISVTNYKILNIINDTVLLNNYLKEKLDVKKNIFYITIFLNIVLLFILIKIFI
jgi:hypothetical protein